MSRAVIRVGAGGRECERECESGIMYSRVKDPIWSIWNPGRRAVSVAGPSPEHRIAHLNRNRAGSELGAAFANGHVRRRRASDHGKEDEENGEQSEMHLSGLLREQFGGGGYHKEPRPE
jgi:hypothetical protein